jgi:periplasmic divalent cation tolerance protein
VEPIVDVHITGPDAGWLAGFARRLVEDRLAACGSVTPGLRSLYRWEGAIQDEPEALLVLHTREALVPTLIERTDTEHPYELPGFRWLPLRASPRYHQWVLDGTIPAQQGA